MASNHPTGGRPCTVCEHPKRSMIDQALATGQRVQSDLGRRYGLTQSALYRHSEKHVPAHLARAAEAAQVADAGRVLARVEAMVQKLEGALSRAEETPELLAVSRELRPGLELLGRVRGEIQAATVVTVQTNLFVKLGVADEAEALRLVEMAREAEAMSIEATIAMMEQQLVTHYSENPESREQSPLQQVFGGRQPDAYVNGGDE